MWRLILAMLATACAAPDHPPAYDPAADRHLGELVVATSPAIEPGASPDTVVWRGLIGDYLAAGDTLIVRERDGAVEGILGPDLYSAVPIGADRFEMHGQGSLDGAIIDFERAADGEAASAVIDGVVYQRLRYGIDAGETFRIRPVRPVETLRSQALAASPPEEGHLRAPDLVDLASLDPTIRFDIRYATTDNFMGAVFYREPRAFLQRPAAEALLRAHQRLRDHGLGVLVHDAYRPWHVTWMFFHATPPELRMFVANPALGSRHNRGAAVDLTLYDLATGKALPMPSGYDEFSPRAFPGYPGGTTEERRNRDRLREVMEAEGFRVYHAEWWHFDHRDWRRYPILNLTFDELDP